MRVPQFDQDYRGRDRTGSGPIGPNWPVSNIGLFSMNSKSVFFLRRRVVPNWWSNDVCAYGSQVKFMWSASNGHLFFSLLWAVWTILGWQWLLLPIVQFREGLTNCSLVLEHDHKIILSSSPASKKAKTFQKFSQSCPHVLSKLSKCCLQVVTKLSPSCHKIVFKLCSKAVHIVPK